MREAILNLITLGIYGIFWTYSVAKTVSEGEKGFSVAASVLSAVLLRFISMALITNKILLSEKA